MAPFKLGVFLLLSVIASLLLSPVQSRNDEEEKLLQDINQYRESLKLGVLNEVNKASCLADRIADYLEDQPCQNANDYYPDSSGNSKFPNLQKLARKCRININTTTDGVIMPVCVPDLEQDAVLSNYTKTDHYAKYLNNSKYTGVGVGSEDDWMVVILSTNSSTGTFSSAASLLVSAWMGHYLLPLFLASLLLPFLN
ncbi:hypothetical protein L6164_035051 [Bauhinia variegata]|uniref:Uncharacterized protein n=1 Tax=Bauhinia variegata TaxID=167791 RepID=A0ACB9KXE2_BAUVA|nr:hypothetical protein L6164_035051 [Bauhinia variegata]